MEGYEEDDINKMFDEIMSSAAISETEEEESIFDTKNLLLIQESLMDSLLCINSLIYRTNFGPEFTPTKQWEESLSSLYQSSEEFFTYMSKNDDIMFAITHIEDEEEDTETEDDEEEKDEQ